MNQEKVGKFIAEARKNLELTQEDIAKKLGITSQSVSKWENGINSPDVTLLLDLCEILEISVDELLDGERKGKVICVKKEKKKEKNITKNVILYKSVILWLLPTFLFLIVGGVALFTCFAHGKEGTFQSIDKEDILVKESLEYISFSKVSNKNLLQKLYDNNENVVTKNDLTNDEKVYLVLNKYKKENALDYYFSVRSDDLRNIIFEEDSFLEEYVKDGVYYTIQNSINYSCHNGIVSYEEIGGFNLNNSGTYFDVLDAKKSSSQLIIEFKVAFFHYYSGSEIKNYYSDVVGYDYLFQQINEEEVVHLDDNFKTFRLNMKLKDNKIYFESLERLES